MGAPKLPIEEFENTQGAPKSAVESHVVDILGSTKGRDQPVMLFEKALQLISSIDEKMLASDDVAFFDPFCKAGEIILAAAFRACQLRISGKLKLMTAATVHQELYKSNRYFALAPDERHYLLSRRTFYGNEQSHNSEITKHIRNGNYLSEIDGRLDAGKFKEELEAMIEYIKSTSGCSKVIAVGNPPYQESDGGFGGSAKAIYNHFVESLIQSDAISEFVVVIPSRWFSAGKGIDEFRELIIKSKEVKSIRHFKQSKEVFPTVDVLGGICFFHYLRGHEGKTQFVEGEDINQIDLSRYDIIPDDPKSYSIIDKIQKAWKGKYVSEIAWARKPFGLATDYFKQNNAPDKNNPNAIPCYTKRQKITYALRSHISKNADKIEDWKVAVPAAYAPGSKMGVRRVTLPAHTYFVIPKGFITTETYTVVGSFKSKAEAEKFLAYLKTDFARYLLGLRKVTQHVPRDRWDWVPLMDTSVAWTDEKLFEHFKLTKQEQLHIKSKVKEWS